MRLFFKFFLGLLIFSSLQCSIVVAFINNKEDSSFTLKPRWTLFSSPCHLSTNELFGVPLNGQVKAFFWDDNGYKETQDLMPGIGYALLLPSEAILSESLCGGNVSFSKHNVQLKAGWNLIGNPYPYPVDLTEVDSHLQSMKNVYMNRGDRLVKQPDVSEILPWKAYWVYSEEDFYSEIHPDIKLEVKVFNDFQREEPIRASASVYVQSSLYLSALLTIDSPGIHLDKYDVTPFVNWDISDTDRAAVNSDGKLQLFASGSIELSASLSGAASNKVNLDIKDLYGFYCNRLILAYENPERNYNKKYYGKGYFSYQYLTSEDSNIVKNRVSDEKYIDSGFVWFKTEDNFQVRALCLIQPFNNTQNDSLYYDNKYWKYIDISSVADWDYDYSWKIPGENFYTELDDYWGYDEYYYSGTFVTTFIGDAGVVKHTDDGLFSTVSEGTGYIKASYQGISSNELEIHVADMLSYKKLLLKPVSESGTFESKYGSYNDLLHYEDFTISVPINGKGHVKVEYIEELRFYYQQCIGFYGHNYYGYGFPYSPFGCTDSFHNMYCFDVIPLITDVTGEVAWNVTGNLDPSIDLNGWVGVDNTGTASVTAKYKNQESNRLEIKTFSSGLKTVELKPEDGIRVSPNGSALLEAYGNYIDMDSACVSYVDNSMRDSDYSGYGAQSISTCEYRVEDITETVNWNIPENFPGVIEGNKFSASGEYGRANLSFEYDGMQSNIIDVWIEDAIWMVIKVEPEKLLQLNSCPLLSCYRIKSGTNDQLKVVAQETSYYYATEYDVTLDAHWQISDDSIVEINGAGVITAKGPGLVWIRANVGAARGEKIWLIVTGDEESEFLITGTKWYGKALNPIKVGNKMHFSSVYYKYSPAASDCLDPDKNSNSCVEKFENENVSKIATWTISNDDIGSISSTGTVTGISVGMTDISTTYKSLVSNSVSIEVWDNQDLISCDPDNINFAVWSSDQSEAVLETDCATYQTGVPVKIRYSAYVNSVTYLDVCLDLYILDSNNEIVRTLRNEGCSTESLHRSSAKSLVYQNVLSWDMLKESGEMVPPGDYFAVSRFYILWEPVIRLPFSIK